MQTENNDTRKSFLENVFLTVVDKMNYNDIIKNTYVLEEEDSQFLDDEIRPFVISANTDLNDKLYFFFVNLSDILPEFAKGGIEPIIPVSYMLLSEYGKSPGIRFRDFFFCCFRCACATLRRGIPEQF